MSFKKGDTVICVDNGDTITGFAPPLTIGDYYVVGETGSDYCKIVNDNGNSVLYSHNRFISLSKYRDKVINSVLDI